MFDLLHATRPVLLDFGAPGSLAIAAWADRVRQVDATTSGQWELPALGPIDAPAAAR